MPTTLMAAIDASIGIKTAINFEGKKNKLGTYCPPLGVFIDRCSPSSCTVPHCSMLHSLFLAMSDMCCYVQITARLMSLLV